MIHTPQTIGQTDRKKKRILANDQTHLCQMLKYILKTNISPRPVYNELLLLFCNVFCVFILKRGRKEFGNVVRPSKTKKN